MIKILLQYIIIISFIGLAIIGFKEQDWNYGFLLNLILSMLYVILYLQPIKL